MPSLCTVLLNVLTAKVSPETAGNWFLTALLATRTYGSTPMQILMLGWVAVQWMVDQLAGAFTNVVPPFARATVGKLRWRGDWRPARHQLVLFSRPQLCSICFLIGRGSRDGQHLRGTAIPMTKRTSCWRSSDTIKELVGATSFPGSLWEASPERPWERGCWCGGRGFDWEVSHIDCDCRPQLGAWQTRLSL